MELLIIYLSTCALSYILEKYRNLIIFKDCALLGYKIDLEKYYEFNMDIYNNSQYSSILRFIPIINILSELNLAVYYNQSKDSIIYRMNVLGVLEDMKEKEKEEFKNNPTVTNAFNISNKKPIDKYIYTFTVGDFVGSRVLYTYDEEEEEITILDVSGKIEELNYGTIKNILYMIMNVNAIIEDGISEGKTKEEIIKDLNTYDSTKTYFFVEEDKEQELKEYDEKKKIKKFK